MNSIPPQDSNLPFSQSFAPPQELGRDDFLQLLVAKLANQDPLSPTDDGAFVAELATFSSLEQLVQVNERLDSLAFGQGELINSQTLELIGKQVLVESDGTLSVRDGVAGQLVYEVPRPAQEVELTLLNEAGEVVRSFKLDPDPQGRVTLDLDAAGRQVGLADGEYTIKVEAVDIEGEPMEIALFSLLSIDGVNFSDGLIRLVSGNKVLDFYQILEIRGQDGSSDR